MATWSWVGAGADANWTTPNNWSLTSGTSLSPIPEPGDDLVFGAGAAQLANTNDYAPGTVFNSIALNASGYSLQGSDVTLNTSLTANYTSGSSTLGLSIGSDADGIAVTKEGAGSLIITGSNTYDGVTTVNHGNVILRSATALGSTNGETIINFNNAIGGGDGVYVQLETSINVAENFTLVSNSSGDRRVSLRSNGGTNTISGTINVQGSGLNVLNSLGGGNFLVTAPITSTGFTGTFLVRGGNNGTISNTINLGTGTFSKTDGGTWTVSAAGNTWNNTQVSVGSLRMGVANALPANTVVNMGQNDGSSPNLNLNGFSQTIAGLTWTAGTGGSKTVTSSTGTPTLTLNSANNYTFGGVITGSLNITRNGSGIQTLTGNNTYTGTTRINNGILRVGSNTALGATSGQTIISGNTGNSGTLELINGVTIAEPITLEARQAGTANAAHIRNVSGNNTLTGNITGTTGGGEYNIYSDADLLTLTGTINNTNAPTRNLRLRGTGSGVASGPITGTWTLHKQEAGVWLLSGDNTYQGTTTVAEGTLQLGSATALGASAAGTSVAAGATLDLNGQTIAGEVITSIIGAGVGGNGAIINSNTSSPAALQTAIVGNNSFTAGGDGDLDLNRVTGTASFTLTKTGAGALTLSGNLDNAYLDLIASGGTVNLAKTAGGGVRAANNATINSGLVRITAGGGDQINAALTINGGTFDLNGYSEVVGALNGVGTIDNTAVGTTSVLTINSGAYSGLVQNTGGVLALAKISTGEFRLRNVNNTYGGGTTVAGGLFRASDRTLGAGNLTLTNGGQFFNVSGNGGTDGFNFEDNNFQKTVTLVGSGGGFRAGWGDMTISGQITGSGGFTVVNDGAITLNNPANDYAGNTTIGASGSGNNATLRLGASEVIPHGAGKGNVIFNASAGGTASLVQAGFTETINGLTSGGAGANLVNNTAGNGQLVVGENNATSTYSGLIANSAGTLALTKIGGGALTLTNANTYGGGTTVTSGSLLINNSSGSATGSGNVVVNGGGTFGGNGSVSGNVNVSGTLSPGLTAGGIGTLAIGGNLALLAGSTYAVDLTALAHDQTTATDISIDATANLAATAEPGLAGGSTFIVLDASGTATGQFATGVPNLLTDRLLTLNVTEQYFLTNGNPADRFPGVVAGEVALVRNNDIQARDNNYTILQNLPFSGNVKTDIDDVAGQDADPDLDATVSFVTGPLPAHGVLTLASDGAFTFTPAPNFRGVASFVYRLSDGETESDATVTIDVTNILVDEDGNLLVSGNTGNDRIIIQSASLGRVAVRFNSALSAPFDIDPNAKVIVYGNAGNDTITVSGAMPFAVEFFGGAGNDYLAGGTQDDILDGGSGNDRLLGSNGDDILLGGPNADRLSGGNGNDVLHGDRYLDPLAPRDEFGELVLLLPALAQQGNDLLNGDNGDDFAYGDGGNDTVNGGVGEDFLRGGLGNDRLSGGNGNDLLIGDDGNDRLAGQNHDDVLLGGMGVDTLLGGTNEDFLYSGALSDNSDQTLADIAAMWFAGERDTVLDAVEAIAVNDGVGETLNGERDADYYLLWLLDIVRPTNNETKSPNFSRDIVVGP